MQDKTLMNRGGGFVINWPKRLQVSWRESIGNVFSPTNEPIKYSAVSTDDWSEDWTDRRHFYGCWLVNREEIRDLFSLKRKKGDALMTGDFVLISDCAFTQPIDIGQLEHGGKHLLQFMRFVEIVQSVLWFFVILILMNSPYFNRCDFNNIE